MADNDKVNILVVDDLPEKVLVLDSILADLGENVVPATSGEEALRKILHDDFAVILLDVNMPGMDGLETAAYIRRRKKSAHTPIIFVTAFADELHTSQGYSLGAVDYILTPVVPDILRSKVKVFVDLFRMTQQVRRQADEQVALAREQAARAAAEEATRRSAFLAEASTVLASSLDVEATLRSLARLPVPYLADLASATEVDADGRPARVEVAWPGPDGDVRSHRIPRHRGPPGPVAEAVARVLATGTTELLADLPATLCGERPAARNGETAPPLLPQSALVLPLLARGRTLGALTLVRGQGRAPFEPAEVAVAEDLAGRAAICLDNARLYQNIQEGDRRKDEFLAMLAHELRNPLAPIRNAVQVMRLVGPSEPSLGHARDIIDRQVTHMARLVDDLLDMSRLSRGKILLRKERLDLVGLVRHVTEDYRNLLESGGLGLEVRLPADPLYLEGDPTRLGQVIGNILQNAAKFTDAGGRVTVELAAEPGPAACVRIRDTGIGMDEEMLDRVFEAFSQADRSLDRSRGGLGLGLALVRGLVDLHGGTVRAASPGPGQGTEIVIRLPLAAPAAEPSPPAAPEAPAEAAYRILIIEDNADTAETMHMLLSMVGHEVAIAADGPAGLARAREFRPDVVLCDIGLPRGMDGYAVARAFRQEPGAAPALLVATTGYGQVEDQRRAREAGFDAHLTKPVDFADLQRLLASLPVRA